MLRVARHRLPLVFATFLAPALLPFYEAVTRRAGELVGLETRLVVGTSFDQFQLGEVDAGFICGLPYVQLTRSAEPPVEALAAPVLKGERFAGRPIYFSDVIVRGDSGLRSFDDLRGCSWSYNDIESQSGCGITLHRLAQRGLDVDFFGRVVAAGWHQESIRLVAAGAVDASAIDCQVLAVEVREHPELGAKLRVIDVLGPSTIQPLAASTALPRSLRKELRQAFVQLGREASLRGVLDFACVAGFAPVDDSSYDDIRAMLAGIEARGLLRSWSARSEQLAGFQVVKDGVAGI
jgi:phosphonate transport system substrate-binding protein